MSFWAAGKHILISLLGLLATTYAVLFIQPNFVESPESLDMFFPALTAVWAWGTIWTVKGNCIGKILMASLIFLIATRVQFDGSYWISVKMFGLIEEKYNWTLYSMAMRYFYKFTYIVMVISIIILHFIQKTLHQNTS